MKHIQFDQFTRLYFVKTALTPQFKSRIRRWCREISSPLEVSTLCAASASVKRELPIPYEELRDIEGAVSCDMCEYFMWFNSRQPSIIVLHATGNRIALLKEAHDYIMKLALRRQKRLALLAHIHLAPKKIEITAGTENTTFAV